MDTPQTVDAIVTDLKALRKISKPTSWKEIESINLIPRLKASNETAWTPGAGLAAVQIGFYLRAAWFKAENKEHILVNPRITGTKMPVVCPKEGCLSIPDIWVQVRRFYEIKITNQYKKETKTEVYTGFAAMVVQHEIDHMDGIVNTWRRYTPPPKVGRNEKCPCGSGKKYKKCCLGKLELATNPPEVKK